MIIYIDYIDSISIVIQHKRYLNNHVSRFYCNLQVLICFCHIKLTDKFGASIYSFAAIYVILFLVCRSCVASGRLSIQSTMPSSTLRHQRSMSLRRTGTGLRWAAGSFYIIFIFHSISTVCCFHQTENKRKFNFSRTLPLTSDLCRMGLCSI